MSELALSLEEAGKKEDISFIKANTDKLLKIYESYKEKLSRLEESKGDKEKEIITEEEYKEAITALKEIIPQMDYDAAEMVIDQLESYLLDEEREALCKSLRKCLTNVDWEGMEVLLQ